MNVLKPGFHNHLLQCLALQTLHHNKAGAAVLPEVVNRAIIRMIEGGSGAGSRWKRFRASRLWETSAGRNLIATVRSRRVSSAL